MAQTDTTKSEKIKYASLLAILAGIFVFISGLLFKSIAIFFSPSDLSVEMAARKLYCNRIGNILGGAGFVMIVASIIILMKIASRNQKDNTPRY
ncbi:MAG TPA: hypothetical protein VF857_08560 [Spirochaetota bacterium]